ncbi:MAG TPA: YkvA family protein [Anaerolineales bacterium]|nr:YkvA family protein [Anaerolineales bacterium]
MANKKDIMIPPQASMIQAFVFRVKLIIRLIGDRRVNPWLKIIPVAGLLYLISPIDIIPDVMLPIIGELDDAAILWLTNYLFVELCPPEIVEEHVRALSASSKRNNTDDDVIDAETVELRDKRQS